MVYYLNRSFNSEQAVVGLVEAYMERMDVDELYRNFHISVTNEHPFAHMLVDSNARCQDTFPAIVITSQNDIKTSDMTGMPLQTMAVGLTATDIDTITNVHETVSVNGRERRRQIPGMSSVAAQSTVKALKMACGESDTGQVYGFSQSIRRTDSISIEIWSENAQLKNELYDALKLYVCTSMDLMLHKKYKEFAASVSEGTVRGERGSSFNFDFDVPLYGAAISFEVDYACEQILVDTEIDDISQKNLIWEVVNHVKD